MWTIFRFDVKFYSKSIISLFTIILFVGLGVFAGLKFNFNAGEGIFINSPYSTGFMLGLFSLAIIFISTFISVQLLFIERDNYFEHLLFSTPLTKRNYAAGRYLALYSLSLTGYLLLIAGFAVGQFLRTGNELMPGFRYAHYLYPLVIFGVVNNLFITSWLALLSWSSKNKLVVALGGILIYILYFIILLFSNSPFMAQSMPQSLVAQRISAIMDPIGLSAYFWESKDFSVSARNNEIVPLGGYFLINRMGVLLSAVIFLFLGYRYLNFQQTARIALKRRVKAISVGIMAWENSSYGAVKSTFGVRAMIAALWSCTKMDAKYLFKQKALVLATVLVLFYLGMEMYAEIEKGIRMPQKFASSRLMVTTILENFHPLGVILAVYFTQDLYWRNSAYKFLFIEQSTALFKLKPLAHGLAISILLMYFSIIAVLCGLAFQIGYGYLVFDFYAYSGVLIYNTLPLVLLVGWLILFNQLIRSRHIAWGLNILCALLFASPLMKWFIPWPLWRFLSAGPAMFSDFNGFGAYVYPFLSRLLFGGSVLGLFITIIKWRGWIKKYKLVTLVGLFTFGALAITSEHQFMRGKMVLSSEEKLTQDAEYEIKYRNYQHKAQPVITAVKTSVHLHPAENRYMAEGEYVLKNFGTQPISQVLVNFPADFRILAAYGYDLYDTIFVRDAVSEWFLQQPILPGDSAFLHFEMVYQWYGASGHQAFNAIIENGSFMRISRYYPQIGYLPSREIQDGGQRKRFGLGEATKTISWNAPKGSDPEAISLDMTISTSAGQVAIGTGTLIREWQVGERNYFHYRTPEPIPFRFAVSSAAYAQAKVRHKNVVMQVYYHPQHHENVPHLLDHARQALDYCQDNFGAYPFPSITFAEVSAFTRGFAATAYPGVIFMTEDMTFHANIQAEKQQDVINELAGHELAHFWWGTSQIVPDEREGASLMTETLAMYTEMMLYKKIYGRDKMMARLNIHEQIYRAERGFSHEVPLYKVENDQHHLSYSKGALVMVKLSDLLGEELVNQALRNFLACHRYPASRPVSTDLIQEFYLLSPDNQRDSIETLFRTIESF